MIEWSKHESGVCRSYADVPRGARIEAVNGRPVADVCETCGKPILDGQEYHLWADVATCKRCGGPDGTLTR